MGNLSGMNEKQTEGFNNRPTTKSPFRPTYVLATIMLGLCLFAVFTTELGRVDIQQPAPPPPGTGRSRTPRSQVNARVPSSDSDKSEEIPVGSKATEGTSLDSATPGPADLRTRKTPTTKGGRARATLVAYPSASGSRYDDHTPSEPRADALLPGQVLISDHTSITTTSGVVYENCTLTRVEPDGISVRHVCGVAKIPFPELPPEYAKAYDYDPDKAYVYAEEAARKREAARASAARGAAPTRTAGTMGTGRSYYQPVSQGTGDRSISPRLSSRVYLQPSSIRRIGEPTPGIRRIGEDDPRIRKLGE